ncbi:MAG: histidinol dehydrogenase [Solirubrobacteraceae bacterium]
MGAIRVRDLRGEHDLRAVSLPRAELGLQAATAGVRALVDDVRARGLEAITELSERFDGVRPAQLRVPPGVIQNALSELDPSLLAGFEEAIRRVRCVHRDGRPEEHTTTLAPGATILQRWIPVRRVGTYAPGGGALYPTSVLMNVIPAQEAGVASIAIASPPQRGHAGLPDANVLAVAGLLGIDEVYAVGGAQAIAMFAYGVRERSGAPLCEPVDMVTGPGNVWVTAAKRLLQGVVGIDTEAGPSEIMILADAGAEPDWLAADLISQAEHDVLAAAVLVTDSEALAKAVIDRLDARVPAAKHSERIRTALAGSQSAIILVRSLEQGLEVIDAHAPEHLEIHAQDAAELARRVRNAGVIFVGPYAPVALGDYCAGSNHVLPTGGSAKYAAGLSAHSFLRNVQVVQYDRQALSEVAGHVRDLADAEGLPAHGAAIAARFTDGGDGETASAPGR